MRFNDFLCRLLVITCLFLALTPSTTRTQEVSESQEPIARQSLVRWTLGLKVTSGEGRIDPELGAWRQIRTELLVGFSGRFWGQRPSARVQGVWIPGSLKTLRPTLLGSMATFGRDLAGQTDLFLGVGFTARINPDLSLSVALGPSFRAACPRDDPSSCSRWNRQATSEFRWRFPSEN